MHQRDEAPLKQNHKPQSSRSSLQVWRETEVAACNRSGGNVFVKTALALVLICLSYVPRFGINSKVLKHKIMRIL